MGFYTEAGYTGKALDNWISSGQSFIWFYSDILTISPFLIAQAKQSIWLTGYFSLIDSVMSNLNARNHESHIFLTKYAIPPFSEDGMTLAQVTARTY